MIAFRNETLMVGIFALHSVLFYMFFEGVLIPMFLIIGVWGGSTENRFIRASKFFLYTLSVLMLLAVIAVYFETGDHGHNGGAHVFLSGGPAEMAVARLLRLFRGQFDVAGAHLVAGCDVQAPTAGSVILRIC